MDLNVADLFARLSLRMEAATFSKGTAAITAVKTALVGLATYKGFDWIRSSVMDVTNYADTYAKLAQQVGIGTEELQKLSYAAELGGANFEAVRVGIVKLAKSIDDAKQGNEAMGKALGAIGARGVKSTNEVLMRMADTFETMPDGPKKTAIAMALLGESGTKLIPMLNAGRQGLKDTGIEFEKLGGVIDEQTSEEFVEFKDGLHRIHEAMFGLKKTVVAAMLPVLKQLADGASEWFTANRAVIKQKLVEFFRVLGKVLLALGKAFAVALDNWKLLATTFGTFKLAQTVIPLLIKFGAVSVSTALKSAAAWVAGMAPFILMAAAIAAVAIILEDLWVGLRGGESAIFALFEAASDWVADKMVDIFGDKLAKAIDKAAAAMHRLGSEMKQWWDDMSGFMSMDWEDWGNVFTGGGAAKPKFSVGQATLDWRVAARKLAPQQAPSFAGGAATGGTGIVGPAITNEITINTTTNDPKAMGDEVRKAASEAADQTMKQWIRSAKGLMGEQ